MTCFLQLKGRCSASKDTLPSCAQIADVSATVMVDGGDEADSAKQEAAKAAHALLLALCTDPSHGLAGGGYAEVAHEGDDGAGAAGTNPAGEQTRLW